MNWEWIGYIIRILSSVSWSHWINHYSFLVKLEGIQKCSSYESLVNSELLHKQSFNINDSISEYSSIFCLIHFWVKHMLNSYITLFSFNYHHDLVNFVGNLSFSNNRRNKRMKISIIHYWLVDIQFNNILILVAIHR